MADWSIPRGISSAQRLLTAAVSHGADRDSLLRNTGITPSIIEDPSAEIAPAQELQLVRNVLAALPQVPELSLEVGRQYRLTDFGIWGYALFASPTLLEGLRLALRYLDLSYVFGELSLDESGPDVRLRFDYARIPADLRQFLIERDTAACVAIQRIIAPHAASGLALYFPFPRPGYAALYKECFGLKPHFEAPMTELVFDRAGLNRPLPQANEATLRMCESECEKLLAQRRGRSGISAKVRAALLRQPGCAPDMEHIASELNMTSRTLRRHLAEEKTTFRELRDEVLLMLAEEMIGTAHMKLAEVAERLGFSDAAAFSHAFKRWKGITPGAARPGGSST